MELATDLYILYICSHVDLNAEIARRYLHVKSSDSNNATLETNVSVSL